MHFPIKHHSYLSDQCIKFQSLPTFKKLLPKNIKALHIQKTYIGGEVPDPSYLHYVKRLKRVKTLTLSPSSFRSRSKFRKASENLFLVKSLRKSLEFLSQESFFNRNCHKNLFKLSKIELELAQTESYQVLPFHRHLKQISFPLENCHSSTKISAAKKLFENYKARFKRSLSRLRDLAMLRINGSGEELKLTTNLLKLFQEVPGLIPNLEVFILHIDGGTTDSFSSKNFANLPALNLLSCLPYVTSFSLKDSHLEMLIFNLSQLRNVQALNLTVKSNNMNQLSYLKTFHELKYLKLKAKLDSKKTEREFFEVFTLPSSLVSVDLTLQGWMWEDCQKPTRKNSDKLNNSIQKEKHFYAQWKGLKDLKHLKLKVQNWWLTHSEVDKNFAINIVRHLKGLESCIFTQSHDKALGSTLELRELFEALKNSRNTIKILNISASNMNFVEDFSPQSFELLKLKEFSLKGSALSSPNTAQFFNNLSVKPWQPIKVIWRSLEVHNIKTLEAVLKSLTLLPKTVELDLKLDICLLAKENWLEILRQAIIKMRFEAKVHLTLLTKSDISGKNALKEIEVAALANPRFEGLFIESRFDKRIYHIFSRGSQ